MYLSARVFIYKKIAFNFDEKIHTQTQVVNCILEIAYIKTLKIINHTFNFYLIT